MKPELLAAALALLTAGCDQAMSDQPRRGPLQASSLFADGRSTRLPVPGTVARGQLRLDEHLFRGVSRAEFAATFPFDITPKVLERGRERFDIFCAPCHDRAGTGRGMIVERGYRVPPSLHLDRLKRLPPGSFFDVITHGVGAMPDYADQIPARDRWAIAAYVRALQFSRDARKEDVPPEELRKLEAESR